MEKLRIVFMGTPDFAVGILDALYQKKYNIVGVITAPDKPAGRGQKVNTSAVKEYALKKNLPLLQPTNLKDEYFLEELKKLNANLQIVVAFRMLPQVVWQLPKYGTFNLHASLLPEYRGAAPINWAIINGDAKTGVTTFFIDEKIDTGAIILQKELPIETTENAGVLHDKLMALGSTAVIETVQLIENNAVQTIMQTENATQKTAFKLNKENCRIDWTKSGIAIYNHIRGLSPYPSSWTEFVDSNEIWNVKIDTATFIAEKHTFEVGKIILTKKTMKIATIDGFIQIEKLKFPGKKLLQINELLNGVQFSNEICAK